jgi:hypothetical protein
MRITLGTIQALLGATTLLFSLQLGISNFHVALMYQNYPVTRQLTRDKILFANLDIYLPVVLEQVTNSNFGKTTNWIGCTLG